MSDKPAGHTVELCSISILHPRTYQSLKWPQKVKFYLCSFYKITVKSLFFLEVLPENGLFMLIFNLLELYETFTKNFFFYSHKFHTSYTVYT